MKTTENMQRAKEYVIPSEGISMHLLPQVIVRVRRVQRLARCASRQEIHAERHLVPIKYAIDKVR